MKPATKNFYISAAVVSALAISFLLVTNVFVDSSNKVYVPETQLQTKEVNSAALFYVTVGNNIVTSYDDISETEAKEKCEEIAFDPDNMWKQVICTYDGVERYNDIFVAG